MKKYAIISLVLLCSTLLSCDDDDEPFSPNLDKQPDTESPVVEIISPAANDSVLVIDAIQVLAELSDDKKLQHVKVTLTDPAGTSSVLTDLSLTNNSNLRQFTLGGSYAILPYAATGEYVRGEYTVEVEARDVAKNSTKNAVTFTLHASDIDREEFTKVFGYAIFNSKFYEPLNLSDYYDWDYGYMIDELVLSAILNHMVNTDIYDGISVGEWAKFIADFDLSNQDWAKWDENSDGSLDGAEFHKGIDSLSFFKDWDTNQNHLFDYVEIGTGIFTHWDHNKNGKLSRNEYLDKFYTYLYKITE